MLHKNKLAIATKRAGMLSVSLGLMASTLISTGSFAAEGAWAIEEITVMARKREESMQDVPLAVSAVTGDTIEKAFLADSTALAQFAPNVVFDKVEAGTPSGGAFSIRGISYQDVEKGFDPTVLLTIDGIAIGTGTANVMNLLDIESIEILRGPQGTLFGKNAVGGIINVRRKKPEFDTTFGKLRMTAGNYGTNNVEGFVNFGGEKTALKLNASRYDHDGYWDNLTTGREDGERTEGTLDADFRWQPTDTLDIRLKGGYTDVSGTANPTLDISGPSSLWCTLLGQCSSAPGEPVSGDRQKGVTEFLETDLNYEQHSFIFDMNWQLAEDYSLTYIFGWMDSEDDTYFDFDGTALDLYRAYKPTEYTQRSHELRLTHDDDVFSWQAGLYYWNADSFSFNQATVFGTSLLFDRAWASSTSYSVFAESDFRITEKLILTTGFRYIEEKKEIEKYVDDGIGGVTIPEGSTGERTDDDVIYRLGLRYAFSDDLMTYVTYSTGFRSGGFSPRANTLDVLGKGQAPETLHNFEVGLKSEWFENRFQLNGALFSMTYEDMQIETNIPGGPSGQQQGFDNIGEATINGLELDFVALLTENWTLSGNAGWLDAKYDKFFTDLYGTGTPADFTDLDLRRAPKFSYSLTSTYTVPLSSGDLSFRAGYNWRDDYEGTLNNHPGTAIEAFGLLDISATYDHHKNWSVSLFARNLTDEDAYSHTFAVTPAADGSSFWVFATPRMPRTYGIELAYSFGE